MNQVDIVIVINNYAQRQIKKQPSLLSDKDFDDIKNQLVQYSKTGKLDVSLPRMNPHFLKNTVLVPIKGPVRHVVVEIKKNKLTNQWIATIIGIMSRNNGRKVLAAIQERMYQESRIREIELLNLQEKTIERFERLGWEIVQPGKSDCYDFFLSHNGKKCGAVSCKTHITQETAQQLQKVIETATVKEKLDVYILTNGVVFDLFICGQYIDTYSIPPIPEDVELMIHNI